MKIRKVGYVNITESNAVKLINSGGLVMESTHYCKVLHYSRMLGYSVIIKEVNIFKYSAMKLFLQ
jgi:hypothetical protein